MKTDVSSLKDIQLIIRKFYKKLLIDEAMRPFFEEIVQQNLLEYHINTIANFWSDILFDTLLYNENVLQKHLHKNTLMQFKKEHFDLWTSYFISTIDAHFQGINSEIMKNRALSIATVMRLKMQVY